MQTLSVKPRGRQSYPNQISKAEPGAMVRAQNVVMDRDDVVEMRRGFKRYGTALSFSSVQKINKFYDFADALLVSYKDKMTRDSDGLGTWSDYSGTYSPPTGANTMRSAQANKNFYLTTSAGLKKLETPSSAFATAGMIRSLDGVATTPVGAGWMNNDTQVAYRIVWGIKDANENLILGAPSQRIIAVNSSGATVNVTLAFVIPSGITTSHFFQVYRSVMSTTAAVTANDELGLVYEASPTAGEIAAAAVSFSDITPENLRGATLYTSPSQQGILQSNDQPPMCRDMATFKNHMFYVNTISKHRFFLTIVSVSGTGLVVDDTVTIGGVLFTAKGAENAAAGQFKVFTAGTPADNIEDTALSLVKIINTYATNTGVYAYYVSGYNDLPGRIMIEERGVGGAAFAMLSNRGNAFNPVLPSSGTTQSSTNSTAKNGISISKNLQPEAVPATNVLYAGSADKNILRIIGLRDSAFILKEDGIFRVTGDSVTNFSVSLFDGTVELIGAETAVAFNNQAFCYSNQGVIAISETGVAVVSREIEGELFVLSALSNFEDTAFAVAYESDRKYVLFTISEDNEAFTVQGHIYNVFTNTWTGPWLMNRSCGIVKGSDDKMYFGSWDQDAPYVYQERKSFTVNDYADEEFAVTVVSSDEDEVVVVSTANLQVKDKIIQGTRVGIVTEITDATHLVVDRTAAWVAGGATAFRPIQILTQFVPEAAQNPGILKHVTEASLMFEKAEFKALSVEFSSNFSTSFEGDDAEALVEGPFGEFTFGDVPFGGGVPAFQPIRVFIPRRKQRCAWLSLRILHEEALSRFAYSGVSYQFEPMSSRMH